MPSSSGETGEPRNSPIQKSVDQKPATPKRTARLLVSLERERSALNMKLAGYTYNDIAARLKITTMGAWKAVDRAMRRNREQDREDAKELATLEKARLDHLQASIWAFATGVQIGSAPIELQEQLSALDRVLKIMDRRAKLEGLDKLPPGGDDGKSSGTDFGATVGDILKGATGEELASLAAIFQGIRERRATGQ